MIVELIERRFRLNDALLLSLMPFLEQFINSASGFRQSCLIGGGLSALHYQTGDELRVVLFGVACLLLLPLNAVQHFNFGFVVLQRCFARRHSQREERMCRWPIR